MRDVNVIPTPNPPYFPQHLCRQSGEVWAGRRKTQDGLKTEWSDGICIFRHFQNSMHQGPTSGLYCQSSWGQNYSVKWERVQKTGTEKTQLQENAPHSDRIKLNLFSSLKSSRNLTAMHKYSHSKKIPCAHIFLFQPKKAEQESMVGN